MSESQFTQKTYRLPAGSADDKNLGISVAVVASVCLADKDGNDDVIGTLPERTQHIWNAPRQCGDWYCEIKAQRYVSAIGPTQREACANAIVKAGGSLAAAGSVKA